MKKPFMATIAATLLTGAALGGTINFDDAKVGELPSGWQAGVPEGQQQQHRNCFQTIH